MRERGRVVRGGKEGNCVIGIPDTPAGTTPGGKTGRRGGPRLEDLRKKNKQGVMEVISDLDCLGAAKELRS